MIRNDQRLAAYLFLSVLCGAWASLGVALIVTAYPKPIGMDGTGALLLLAVTGFGILLVVPLAGLAGTVAVRRVSTGVWRWRSLVVACGVGAAASALGGLFVTAWLPVVAVLFASQVFALVAFAALLRPTLTA